VDAGIGTICGRRRFFVPVASLIGWLMNMTYIICKTEIRNGKEIWRSIGRVEDEDWVQDKYKITIRREKLRKK
jgi:hypothetical protein